MCLTIKKAKKHHPNYAAMYSFEELLFKPWFLAQSPLPLLSVKYPKKNISAQNTQEAHRQSLPFRSSLACYNDIWHHPVAIFSHLCVNKQQLCKLLSWQQRIPQSMNRQQNNAANQTKEVSFFFLKLPPLKSSDHFNMVFPQRRSSVI